MFLHHLSKFDKFSLKIGGEIIFPSWLLSTPFFNLTIVQWLNKIDRFLGKCKNWKDFWFGLCSSSLAIKPFCLPSKLERRYDLDGTWKIFHFQGPKINHSETGFLHDLCLGEELYLFCVCPRWRFLDALASLVLGMSLGL